VIYLLDANGSFIRIACKHIEMLTLTGLLGLSSSSRVALTEAKTTYHHRTADNEIVPGPYASLIWVM
jgi:hypothetical protein